MTPENDIPEASYALLASGANFSCEVMQALLQRHHPPTVVILPEFAPAQNSIQSDRDLLSSAPYRRLLALSKGISTAYAPAAQQADCARFIEQNKIDFLLIACWPYLIDSVLIDSARKAAVNMHPSLLPNYRGPNPVEQQLAAHEPRPGVTLHLLNQHFDQGDIIAQAELEDLDTKPDRLTLERYCAELGVTLFIDALARYNLGWKRIPQRV